MATVAQRARRKASRGTRARPRTAGYALDDCARCAVAAPGNPARVLGDTHMSSFMGKPRTVTDEQVAAILEWKRNQKSLKQLAAELDLKPSTVKYVIAVNGQFKQPSPEKRAKALEAHRLKKKAPAKRRES